MTTFRLDCILFDLDGTLLDTAPDLLACLNEALTDHGYAAADHAAVRPAISLGALAMVEAALGDVASAESQRMVDAMLARYENNIARYSQFFDGMTEVLDSIERRGLKWGVVTNKKQRYTTPLMAALRLDHRAACIVSGDSTPFSKPHPEPMRVACRQAGGEPQNCIYIGDAAHDIAAGNHVNMKTLVAAYGYLKDDDQPEQWGAHALIDHPRQLLNWIDTSS